jgi:hypothetical protein
MSSTTTHTEVKAYLEAVRSHLADLPGSDRDDLLEDLEQHLLEVAAEEDGTLRERLGPPDVFASELRTSAGLGSPAVASGGVRHHADALLRRAGLTDAFTTIWSSPLVTGVRAFLPELRPGWWVLRGYLIALFLDGAFGYVSWDQFPIPSVRGSVVGGALLVGVAIWASVAIGRRTPRSGVFRWVSVALSLATAVAGFAAIDNYRVNTMSAAYAVAERHTMVRPPPFLSHWDGTTIANICAYDASGKPLEVVQLFDESGRPIGNVAEMTADGMPVRRQAPTTTDGRRARFAFPHAVGVPAGPNGELAALPCPARSEYSVMPPPAIATVSPAPSIPDPALAPLAPPGAAEQRKAAEAREAAEKAEAAQAPATGGR